MLDLKSRNRLALKEWAVACRRLAEGRQILLLRKGGLRELREGFHLEHREFFLYPTFFHQCESELTEEARCELDAPPRDPSRTSFDTYARVEDAFYTEDLESLLNLAGLHHLSAEAVAKRFHYRRPGLWVLALRCFRLLRPHTLDNRPEYEGCHSWVRLHEEIPVEHSGPVLNRTEFRKHLEELQRRLDKNT